MAHDYKYGRTTGAFHIEDTRYVPLTYALLPANLVDLLTQHCPRTFSVRQTFAFQEFGPLPDKQAVGRKKLQKIALQCKAALSSKECRSRWLKSRFWSVSLRQNGWGQPFYTLKIF